MGQLLGGALIFIRLKGSISGLNFNVGLYC